MYYKKNNENDQNNNYKFYNIKEKIENLFDKKKLILEYPCLKRILYKFSFDIELVHFILNLINFKIPGAKSIGESNDKANIIKSYSNNNIINANSKPQLILYKNVYLETDNTINYTEFKNEYIKDLINSLKLNRNLMRLFNRKELLTNNYDCNNIDVTCDQCYKLKKDILKSRKINELFEEEVSKINCQISELQDNLISLKSLRREIEKGKINKNVVKELNDKISNIDKFKLSENYKDYNNFSYSIHNNANVNDIDIDKLTIKVNKNTKFLESKLNEINLLFVSNKNKLGDLRSVCFNCKNK
jgi:hypothetical protein